MKNELIAQLESITPQAITIPDELKLLYRWIEDNSYYIDIDNQRFGFLFPQNELKISWTSSGRDGGTDIVFSIENSVGYWSITPEIAERLCIFGQTGADGSVCALWLDDENNIRIVHMGSGSGSTLMCVLADNMVDFLRLIAIGYDEICWDEEFNDNPRQRKDFIVKPNIKFQNWVKNTFNTTIPKTASEIVKFPAVMEDDESDDLFFNWIKSFNIF